MNTDSDIVRGLYSDLRWVSVSRSWSVHRQDVLIWIERGHESYRPEKDFIEYDDRTIVKLSHGTTIPYDLNRYLERIDDLELERILTKWLV